MFKPPFNWFNKFGSLPATYKEAMSYEEQIMWLCKEVQRNESYAEEFQAVINQINESIGSINSDIDDVYRNLNDLASKKEDRLVQGTGLLLHRITPIEGTPTVRISTSPIDVSELLISGSYIPLADKEVGDVIDITPVTSSNTAYFMKYVEAGEVFEIVGNCDIAKINDNNEITLIDKNNEGTSFDEPVTFTTFIAGTLIISFTNTDTNVPEIREFITTDYIFDEINKKQEHLIAGNGISINGNVISATGSGDDYVDISSLLKQNQYIDFSNKNVGDTLSLEPVSSNYTAYYIKEVSLMEEFKIVGSYILAEIDSNNVIVNKESGTATAENPYIYDCMTNLPSRARFVITFENTDISQPSIYDNVDKYYVFNNIEGGKRINKLKEDLHLDDSTPDSGLLEGLYFTNGYKVYVGNTEQTLFNNALFYATKTSLYIIFSTAYYLQSNAFVQLYYATDHWATTRFNINTEWNNIFNRPSINDFTQDLNLVDGTGTTGLADGLYYTGQYHLKVNNVQDDKFNRALILADTNNVLYVIASPTNNHAHEAYYEVYYDSSSNTWKSGYSDIRTDWSQIDNKPAIATSITSTSTNDEIAGAKAVYDLAKIEDITSQVTFTPESGITVTNRTVYKRGNAITLILSCQYTSRNAGIFSLGTLSLTPLYQSYGVGTSYDMNVGVSGAFGRIGTSGAISGITLIQSEQITFNIDFTVS